MSEITYKCPCGMQLIDLKSVSYLREPPKLDDILLCGMCGRPSKVTLTGLTYLTDEDFAKLSPDETKDLMFAQRAVKRQLKNN